MKHNFDINIDYPLEDFKKDMDGLIAKGESNVIDFPPRLGIIDDKTGEVTTLRFKTTSAIYISATYFMKRYGPSHIAQSRWMKFMAVLRFVGKWNKLLIQKGLFREDPLGIKDDFVEYLLRVKINPRSGIIPKLAINAFLNTVR